MMDLYRLVRSITNVSAHRHFRRFMRRIPLKLQKVSCFLCTFLVSHLGQTAVIFCVDIPHVTEVRDISLLEEWHDIFIVAITNTSRGIPTAADKALDGAESLA